MPKNTKHQPTSRVLDILELLASSEEGLTLTELSQAAGTSKSTIFPVLKTLTARRYAKLDPSVMRYSLGLNSFALAGIGLSNSEWLSFIQEKMLWIATDSGEVCQLGILDGPDVLYIAKVEPQRKVRLISHVGKRLPASATALGKAMLASLNLQEVKNLYPNGLPRHTKYSVKSFTELGKQLKSVSKLGYASDNRELDDEIICLAVPLRQRGSVPAALSVSIPVFRAGKDTKAKVLSLLFEAQGHIEEMLSKLPSLLFTE
jgi:DNA-binding IclR family transcriptional regulator